MHLFLDRDGVINRRLPGAYVKTWNQFDFLEGVLEAIAILALRFHPIIVVTNQQGIGKGLMSSHELELVHQKMIAAIEAAGGRIDAVYYCGDLSGNQPNCRKPNPSMAFQAKKKFPQLEFSDSIIVGDSLSDIEFGANLGMKTVLIETKLEELGKIAEAEQNGLRIDLRYKRLIDFALEVEKGVFG